MLILSLKFRVTFYHVTLVHGGEVDESMHVSRSEIEAEIDTNVVQVIHDDVDRSAPNYSPPRLSPVFPLVKKTAIPPSIPVRVTKEELLGL